MAMSANIIKNNVPVLNVGSEGAGALSLQARIQRPNQNIPMEYPAMALRTPNQPLSIFRHTYQTGFLSILYAIGQRPLENWEKQVKDIGYIILNLNSTDNSKFYDEFMLLEVRTGYVKRITDPDIRSLAIEVMGPNVATTFLSTPLSPVQTLGIRLPIVVFVIKNLKKYFSYEILIVDDTKTRRRFLVSNFLPSTKVRPFAANIPLKMDEGWNQVSLHLADMTRKLFGTEYKETVRVQIHANCRIRRVYFCDRIYGEDEIPMDFKLFIMNASRKDGEANGNEAVLSRNEIPEVITMPNSIMKSSLPK